MKKVNVKKDDLVDQLKVNLKKHLKDIKEVKSLRRDEVRNKMLQEVEKIEEDPKYQPESIMRFKQLTSYEADYKKAIKMAEMSVDEVIELSDDEFSKFVMDNWAWSTDFATTLSAYSGA